MIAAYLVFIKKDKEEPNLVTTSNDLNTEALGSELDTNNIKQESEVNNVTGSFLSLLLNVKSISLEDKIFSDIAFISLKDSSILITQDGTEGRPNPFAPIGTEVNTSLQNLNKPTTPEPLPVSSTENTVQSDLPTQPASTAPTTGTTTKPVKN